VAVAPEAEVERRRREDRGAEGAEAVGCGEGVHYIHIHTLMNL